MPVQFKGANASFWFWKCNHQYDRNMKRTTPGPKRPKTANTFCNHSREPPQLGNTSAQPPCQKHFSTTCALVLCPADLSATVSRTDWFQGWWAALRSPDLPVTPCTHVLSQSFTESMRKSDELIQRPQVDWIAFDHIIPVAVCTHMQHKHAALRKVRISSCTSHSTGFQR